MISAFKLLEHWGESRPNVFLSLVSCPSSPLGKVSTVRCYRVPVAIHALLSGSDNAFYNQLARIILIQTSASPDHSWDQVFSWILQEADTETDLLPVCRYLLRNVGRDDICWGMKEAEVDRGKTWPSVQILQGALKPRWSFRFVLTKNKVMALYPCFD